MTSPLEVVQRCYQCFAAGDIPSLLALAAPDSRWRFAGAGSIIPWAGEYVGPEGLAEFLGRFTGAVEIEQFEPQRFVAEGDMVVALGFERCCVKATGRIYDSPWAHVFTVADGRVTSFFEHQDTAAMAVACA